MSIFTFADLENDLRDFDEASKPSPETIAFAESLVKKWGMPIGQALKEIRRDMTQLEKISRPKSDVIDLASKPTRKYEMSLEDLRACR